MQIFNSVVCIITFTTYTADKPDLTLLVNSLVKKRPVETEQGFGGWTSFSSRAKSDKTE